MFYKKATNQEAVENLSTIFIAVYTFFYFKSLY